MAADKTNACPLSPVYIPQCTTHCTYDALKKSDLVLVAHIYLTSVSVSLFKVDPCSNLGRYETQE